jgi:ribosome-binding protein aMBF1 (putative translation factor)
MTEPERDWTERRARRLTEPGAAAAYDVARIAYELGQTVRRLREQRNWSQGQLGAAAGMTQSAVARLEAGGTVPTLSVLERVARALDARLDVSLVPLTGGVGPPADGVRGWAT